ncbi:hypothetical protein QTO34_004771, partial [Cnephaeus nilssonii]
MREHYRAHPLLEERATLLGGQSVHQVGPQGLLYVQQRELAVTTSKDGSTPTPGSDDATTCHIVVLRHTVCSRDNGQLSQKYTHQLLSEFDRQEDKIHLMTFYVTELNDLEENENHFPMIYGLAVNTESAEIHRASFQDCGPEELPAAPALAGGARCYPWPDSALATQGPLKRLLGKERIWTKKDQGRM